MNEFKNYSVNILRTEEKFGYLSLSQFKNYSVNILLKEVYLLRLGFLDLKTTQLIFYKFQPNNVLTHSIFKNYSVNILQIWNRRRPYNFSSFKNYSVNILLLKGTSGNDIKVI